MKCEIQQYPARSAAFSMMIAEAANHLVVRLDRIIRRIRGQ
ncbi:hypothetical protein QEZ52_12615 [Aliisedimentitalea scapharcae]|uniref:Uncharacterized protein n=1 Tax=Aliisedimentitalea scapharcae TaxID=1524259 RepID=A0ABZ2XQ02_9RHOB